MQGSELFLGLPHERLASSLCPARAFWRCSNPSAISARSARSWRSPSTCACSQSRNPALRRGRQLGRESDLPARTAGARPAHPWEHGTGRKDHAAFAPVERWGDSCSASVDPVRAPGLQTLPDGAPSTLQAGCHLWGSSLGQGMPQTILACMFPYPAFLPRGNTNRGLSLCPSPQRRATQGVTPGPAWREQPPPSAPGVSLQSDRPAKKIESSFL